MSLSLNGYVLVDKPAGPTSHAVISRFRKVLGKDTRIGHLGTLDPFATGLLPVLIGGATRLADAVMEGSKQYAFTIGLGEETDTLDPQGKVVAQAPVPVDWERSLPKVLDAFRGEIEQVPPVYSALKMNGRPLYEHIRATGSLPEDIETKRRRVTIESLEVERVDLAGARLRLRVVCTKGTYVRSLARDISKALGSVGTCVELRREAVGTWRVQDALHLGEELPAKDAILAKLLPPERMRPDLPLIDLPEKFHARLLAGNYIDLLQSEESRGKIVASLTSETLFLRGAGVMFWADWEQRAEEVIRLSPRKRVI